MPVRITAMTLALLACLALPQKAMASTLMPESDGELRELTWKEEDGSKVSLAALRGKPLVLHFWAAWCTACVDELPSMIEWSEQHRDITVIFVSLDQKTAQARYFIDKHQLPIQARLATMGDLGRFGLRGLPATILLDAEGRETGRVVGAADWHDESFTGSVAAMMAGKE